MLIFINFCSTGLGRMERRRYEEFDNETKYTRRRDAIEEDGMLGTVLIGRLGGKILSFKQNKPKSSQKFPRLSLG